MLTAKQIAAIITSEMNQHPSQATPDNIEAAAQKIHDLCKPDHTIHVAAAAMENEVTDALIDMLVATVLAKLIDQEGGGRTNFSFSPMDMAAVMKEWDYTVERDGMIRTVRIKPKDDSEYEVGDAGTGALLQYSSLARSMSRADEEMAPPPISDLDSVKPQAEPHEYNRPLWAVHWDDEEGTKMSVCPTRQDAEDCVRDFPSVLLSRVENRWCEHPECPTTGCLYDTSKRDGSSEVASD